MTCAALSDPLNRPEIERIARAYPPDARFTPVWEREQYFTPLQQAAWALRFEPQNAEALTWALT